MISRRKIAYTGLICVLRVMAMLDMIPRLEAGYILGLLSDSTAQILRSRASIDLKKNKLVIQAESAEDAFSLRFNYHNQLVQALNASQGHSITCIEYRWEKSWIYPLTLI